MNILKYSALLIAVITSLLYCASMAYFVGVSSYFNLIPELLEKNFHMTIYSGYIAVINNVLFPFVKILIWPICIYVPIIYFLKNNSLITFRAKRKIVKYRRKTVKFIRDIKSILSNTYASIVIIICFFVVLTVFFQGAGYLKAKKVKDEIDNNELNVKEIRYAYIGNAPKKVYLLTCGTRNCAAIDLKTKIVYHFPQGQIIGSILD